MDGLSGAMSGVLRGAGKPGLGAYINIAAYYVIGLPVGLFVTFAGPKWGLNGTLSIFSTFERVALIEVEKVQVFGLD